MGDLILTKSATLLCPHGGIVIHHPLTYSNYRIEGQPVLLLNDMYTVVGCSSITGTTPNFCASVTWTSGSTRLLVKGIPALLVSSTGLCMNGFGVARGPVIVAAFQTLVREPDNVTVVE